MQEQDGATDIACCVGFTSSSYIVQPLPGSLIVTCTAVVLLHPRRYKAKPHWGKNHQRDFMHPRCHIVDHLPFWEKAMAFRSSSDPDQIFEPQLFADMAAKAPHRLSEGCALRGECFCEQDEHCAPGFQCVPSLAFSEYKCCKPMF